MTGAARLAGYRIPVVEDSWFVSRELDRLLTDHGAVLVGPAATVEKALDLVRQDGFGLWQGFERKAHTAWTTECLVWAPADSRSFGCASQRRWLHSART